MEPPVFNAISNMAVCNFFYIFFVVYAVLLAITVMSGLGTLLFAKLPTGQQIGVGVAYGIGIAIITVEMLFMYLMCDRALIAPSQQAPIETFRSR